MNAVRLIQVRLRVFATVPSFARCNFGTQSDLDCNQDPGAVGILDLFYVHFNSEQSVTSNDSEVERPSLPVDFASSLPK
jgi:hypothetical protein